jgi:hypothetical protein
VVFPVLIGEEGEGIRCLLRVFFVTVFFRDRARYFLCL